MARGAAKRTATRNTSHLSLLFYGFLLSNTWHVVIHYLVLRRTFSLSHVVKYTITEGIALTLWYHLHALAREGHDLDGKHAGMSAYMLDVVYVTWLTHFVAAWWRMGWWVYACIPLYAIYVGYTKILLPYVFKGHSPFAAVYNRITGGGAGTGNGTAAGGAPAAGTEQTQSKRQAKLQARAERGDPRVQMRKR